MKRNVVLAVLAGLLCLSLGSIKAQADDASGNYVNIGKFGVGPSLDLGTPPIAAAAAGNQTLGGMNTMGTINGRYWLNNHFGLDVGFGYASPYVGASPASLSLIDLRVEGLYSIAQSAHNVLYANVIVNPVFASPNAGNTATFLGINLGFGVEHAFQWIPSMAFYTEWEPLTFATYWPGGGAASQGSDNWFGSYMNFGAGLRYYF
jgi:hypothetical protein